MKSAISLTTPSTGLSGTQFSVLESMIPKGQKKYNNTEVKYRAVFYGHLWKMGKVFRNKSTQKMLLT
jgi:hypothetical protein